MTLLKLREKGLDHLRSYGCVTISEEKKYNIKKMFPIVGRQESLPVKEWLQF